MGYVKKVVMSIVLVLGMVFLPMGPVIPANAAGSKSGMKISAGKVILVKGSSQRLTVKGGSGIVKWKSSNSKVVTVSDAGRIVAKKAGKAVVTVSKGTSKKTCKVIVENARLSKTKITIDDTSDVTLRVLGCRHAVKWESSDTEICDVRKGELSPYDTGTVTITANVHGVQLKCKVNIVETDADDDLDEDYEDDYDEDEDEDDEDDYDDDYEEEAVVTFYNTDFVRHN